MMQCEATELRLESGQQVQAMLSLSDHPQKCILIHGNPGSLSDWQPVMQRLASVADVVAIDLPGFGRSARPRGGRQALSLQALADSVTAVADALSWRTPLFVVGHSHGGGVAQTLAARHPSRVAGIALLGTLGSPMHLGYRLLATPGATAVASAVGASFGSSWLRPLNRWLVARVSADIFAPERVPKARVDRELASFAARPELLASMVDVAAGQPCLELFTSAPRIRCPVLFLHGAADKQVPLECARAIHRQIEQAGGNSRFEVMPGAGHMLLEFQAAEVAGRIAEFMKAEGTSGA